jgi:hypothetical protein
VLTAALLSRLLLLVADIALALGMAATALGPASRRAAARAG